MLCIHSGCIFVAAAAGAAMTLMTSTFRWESACITRQQCGKLRITPTTWSENARSRLPWLLPRCDVASVQPCVECRFHIPLAHIWRRPLVDAARHVETQHGVPGGSGGASVSKCPLKGVLAEPPLPCAVINCAPAHSVAHIPCQGLQRQSLSAGAAMRC